MTTALHNSARAASFALLATSIAVVAACSESAPPSPPATTAPTAAPASPAAQRPQPAPPPSAPATGPAKESTATSPAPAGDPGTSLTVMGVRFPLPAGFRQVPPANQMRLAEVEVADAPGDAAKALTIAFSTAGGTVKANLDRWAGQMLDASGAPAKATITPRETDGVKWTDIEAAGTFVGMGQGPAKPEWMLRGAVIELPKGLLFVKMTGPAASMKAHGSGFEAMMTGMVAPR